MKEVFPEEMRQDCYNWYSRAKNGESFSVQKAFEIAENVARFHISFQSYDTNAGKIILVLAKDL